MGREDCEHICFAIIFACVVGKNPKTPKLSPVADNAIARGGIGLGSLLNICASSTVQVILTSICKIWGGNDCV